jgi:hypothetical protein
MLTSSNRTRETANFFGRSLLSGWPSVTLVVETFKILEPPGLKLMSKINFIRLISFSEDSGLESGASKVKQEHLLSVEEFR